MGEVIFLDQVVIRIDEVEAVPNAVRLVVAQNALARAFEQQASARRQLAPAMLRIVVVVGKIAVLDPQRAAVARHQPGGKAPGFQKANRDVDAAFEQDANPGLLE